jgi:Protein of unknown function (DUF707)
MGLAKSLFASPVGKDAKDNIRKILNRFGHASFDFLLLVYDDSRYDEECFDQCTVIYDQSLLFWQLKRHLTPELCERYEYVFVWVDDLDILSFDPGNFLGILRRHGIEVAHPSLSPDSVISHRIMVHRRDSLGRYTDFVEQMAMVFKGNRWRRFWNLISPTEHPWGWGYDEVAYSYCRFFKMAIIDAEIIRHTRKGTYLERAQADQKRFHQALRRFHFSHKRTLCGISEKPAVRWTIIPLRLHLYHALVRLYVLLGVGYVR